jgi:alkylated DNA repair dioxygenase AlkB
MHSTSHDFVLSDAFLAADEAAETLNRFARCIMWRQDQVRVFGSLHKIPRLHQWFADDGLSYRWSGITMLPEPWFAELSTLRERVSAAADSPFNSVLINYYRDGNDTMGWHSDDEPELGANPVIASLSLGATRDFKLRPKAGVNAEPHTLALNSGSLLVMSGLAQRHWQHSLPKRKRVLQPRMNLTFRQIITA